MWLFSFLFLYCCNCFYYIYLKYLICSCVCVWFFVIFATFSNIFLLFFSFCFNKKIWISSLPHAAHLPHGLYFLNPFFPLLYSVKTSYLTKGWTQIIKNNLAFARFTFSLLLFPSIYIYIYICICFVLILNFSFVFCFDNKHKNLLLARSFLLSKFSFHMIFVVSRFSAHVFPFCIFIYV